MNEYDQTNIKNNIIYFPLWRVKYLKHRPWSWEERYDIISVSDEHPPWTHNSRVLGGILLESHRKFCPNCGANRLNEPTTEQIINYMDLNYE